MSLMTSLFSIGGNAAEISIGAIAPTFQLKDQDGQVFDLNSRKDHWTVLYFYPKSETPGCTKQACAFRDNLKKVTDLGAEVFGVSVNAVVDQKMFQEHHKLNFTLLADEDGKVTKLYGAKMPMLNVSKRWTFIIGPDLKIRAIDKDVDPIKDVENVYQTLKKQQATK